MANARCQQVMLPAETMRGGKLATDFRDALTMARDGWTAFGSPTYAPNGGAILDGTTQYFSRPLAGELYSASLTFHIEFYPTFAPNDGADHYLCDTPTGRTIIYKRSTNALEVYMGSTTLIITAALAEYSAHWRVGERNLLSVSATSAANALRLNGVEIKTSNIAWTPQNPTTLFVGARNSAVGLFAGRITSLKIGHHTSTLAEHLAYWNRTMWNWENRCDVNLQFRMQDYDPTLVRTLDSSGHGNHFTLGDGSTPTTYPTQGAGQMSFDGGDSLRLASYPQPTGAFSVGLLVADASAAGDYVAYHANAAFTDVSWVVYRAATGVWRFYVGSSAYVYSSAYLDKRPKTVIGTWDGTTAQIYIDGVLDKAGTSNVPAQPAGVDLPMWLGMTSGGGGPMTGTMYDFKYRDGEAWNNLQALDYTQKMFSRIGSEI